MVDRNKKTTIVFSLCMALVLQQSVFAGQPSFTMLDGVKIFKEIENLSLDQDGLLQGAVVGANGRAVQNAAVVVAQKGSIVASIKSTGNGRFAVKGLKPGVYQVATLAGVRTYRVWDRGDAPSGSLAGSIHVMDADTIARGSDCDSCDGGCDGCGGGASKLEAICKNPFLWAVVIAAAIAIPIALDDDDAS